MIENLRIATWTHSSYDDVWPVYYGQFSRHANFFNHSLILNERVENLDEDCRQIVNNENDPFYKRMILSLNEIEEDFIIYMQEDFILYGDVVEEKIKNLQCFLEDSDYSFIRLMKSGVEGGSVIDENMGLHEVPNSSQYLYCLQATMWKRKHLMKLFSHYSPVSMVDAELRGSHACRDLGIEGCYVYNQEPKRGRLHYDSKVFPYISTALYGGSYGGPSRWQTSLYPNEIRDILKIYNIDPSIRGEI